MWYCRIDCNITICFGINQMEKVLSIFENVDISLSELLNVLHIDETSDEEYVNEIVRMREEAIKAARPKALYGFANLEACSQDEVNLNGVCFCSSLLKENLEKSKTIIPYIVTCGIEAEQWSMAYQNDPLAQFWADEIKLQLLSIAIKKLRQEVSKYFPHGRFSSMSPGSISAWPLTQQRPLFKLLGNVGEKIGVELTQSCLMLPSKSSSGIFFISENDFNNCRYCPKLECPNRSAPFEKELESAQEYKSIFAEKPIL